MGAPVLPTPGRGALHGRIRWQQGVLNVRISFLWATLVASLLLLCLPHARAQSPARGTNIGLIDINYIFKNHRRFKMTMDNIKKDIETFETHLRNEQKKIQQSTERLKSLTAGSAEYNQLETQIAGMHTQLQLDTARKRKEILDREAKVYYGAYREIEEAVAKFAHRYGFGLILRFNSEPMDPSKRESVLAGVNRPVVFQHNKNITQQILKELNHETPPPNVGGRPQIPQGINRR